MTAEPNVAEPVATEELPAFQRLRAPGPEHDLFRPLVGVFAVENHLWPAPGAEPLVSTAVARRRMVDDLYLEEVMAPAVDSGQPPFTRICYLDFNYVNRRWEYVSLDTRIPAYLMYETSVDETVQDGKIIVLHLPSFTLPGWGAEVTGQTVRQRRELVVESADRQVMFQYWTLPASATYLAVHYTYDRLE
jgi:hypothetical protein